MRAAEGTVPGECSHAGICGLGMALDGPGRPVSSHRKGQEGTCHGYSRLPVAPRGRAPVIQICSPPEICQGLKVKCKAPIGANGKSPAQLWAVRRFLSLLSASRRQVTFCTSTPGPVWLPAHMTHRLRFPTWTSEERQAPSPQSTFNEGRQ